jgi:hypothetical protein
MSLRGDRSAIGSPVQHHPTLVVNDLQVVEGTLDTLGNPHNYLNQEGMDYLLLTDTRVTPWDFTGLPHSRPAQIVLMRDSVQFLIFRGEEAQNEFHEPPRTSTLMLNLPTAIIRGAVPFLSEARLGNFLDFWKGVFFPVIRAQIHYLAPLSAEAPSEVPLLYVNRNSVQSYIQA